MNPDVSKISRAAMGSAPGPRGTPTRRHRQALTAIWCVSVALIALAWWLVAGLIADSRERALDAAGRDLANLVLVSEEHADRTIRIADQATRLLQTRFQEQGARIDIPALVRQGLIDMTNLNQVGIIDAQGVYAYSSLREFARVDLSDRAHFRVHLDPDSDRLFVSQPLLGRASGKWSVQFTRRINRADGELAGVAVVSVDPEYFTRFYSQLNLGAGGLAALYGLDGVARARRTGSRDDFGADASGGAMLRRILGGELAGAFDGPSVVDGIERLMHFRRLPYFPLVVVVGRSVDEILSSHQRIRRALLGQAAAVSALILALAIATTRHLVLLRRESLAALQARAENEDRTEQLAQLFALSPDGLLTFDAQRAVKYVNPAFCAMTHAREADVVGLPEAEFLAWLSERPGIDLRLYDEEAGVSVPVPPVPAPTGSVPLRDRRVLQIRRRDSRSFRMSRYLHVRDITREVELDAVRNDFMSTAAHELRTPMASIFGFSELLLAGGLDEATRREFVEIVHSQAGNVSRIVDDLLDLARIDERRRAELRPETLDLGELLEDLCRAVACPAGRTPPMLQRPDTPCRVIGDPAKLRQVFVNVISNAYKYSPAGGPVNVRLLPLEVASSPVFRITIADTGIGMSLGQVERVFERFFRADRSGQIPGSGLGMSIARAIVDLHQGDIQIQSQLGQGTTVTVILPAAPQHP